MRYNQGMSTTQTIHPKASTFMGHPGAWRSEAPTGEFLPVRAGDTIEFVPRKLPSNHPLAPRVSAAAQIRDGFKPLWHLPLRRILGKLLILILKTLFFVGMCLAFAVLFVTLAHVMMALFSDKKSPIAFNPQIQS